jgi:hypothetical protein
VRLFHQHASLSVLSTRRVASRCLLPRPPLVEEVAAQLLLLATGGDLNDSLRLHCRPRSTALNASW